MASGPVTSVMAIDMDGDSDLEVVAAGRVISSWNEDGTPLATAGADGTLFNPVPDDEVATEDFLFFWGEIAGADIDDDGDTEIVGMFADGGLYAVDENGDEESGFPKTSLDARSTPTLADLDPGEDDGEWEILVNGHLSNDLYIFNADGSPYGSRTTGKCVVVNDGNLYNYSGVAVGDIDESSAGLEIVQPVQNAHVIVWESIAPVSEINPDQVWDSNPCDGGTPCDGPYSTPVVADVNADEQPDVVLNSMRSNARTVVLEGAISDGGERRLIRWMGSGADELFFQQEFIQSPAVGDLGNANGYLEVVTARLSEEDGEGSPSDRYKTVASLLHAGTQTLPTNLLRDGIVVTAADTIPLPGGRGEVFGRTTGNPILADIDDDGQVEMLASASHAALFAWQLTPGNDGTFTYQQELGWPLTYSEPPCVPAVADLDGDDKLEPIVGVGDGYVYVYDLPSDSEAEVPWPTAAYDNARSGNFAGGAQARGAPSVDAADASDAEPTLQLSPNPFNPRATIRYASLPGMPVRLSVYDAQGREVRRLVESPVAQGGIQTVVWEGRDDSNRRVAAGVYFVRMEGEGLDLSRRLVLVK